MSWQRIIEVARKQGMPVIVTDVAGREPMVLLPLEGYERLVDGGGVPKNEEKPHVSAKNVEKQSEQAVPRAPTPVPVSVSSPATPPGSPSLPPASHSQPAASNPDSLRRRQRDGDRVEMLHRSLDTVSQVVGEGAASPGAQEPDLLLEERFSFQP